MLLATLTLATACSASPARPAPTLTDAMYPWTLRPVAELPGNHLWQQRLTVRIGERENSLQAVLQKQGDHLLLLGLTPFGTKAFALEQRGVAVSFEAFVDRKLPFPPRYVLVDVQRCHLPLGDPHTQPKDGEERLERDGEAIVQVFADGRLQQRRFRRLDGVPAGEIRISYRDRLADGSVKHVTIDNRWFGYKLDITTLSSKPLPAVP